MNSEKGNTIAAIASDDHETLSVRIFGRANYFEIYRISPEHIEHLETRSNPFATTNQRGKTFDVIDVLSDCQLMVAHRIGKKGIERMKAAGLECMETEPQSIEKLWHEIKQREFTNEILSRRNSG